MSSVIRTPARSSPSAVPISIPAPVRPSAPTNLKSGRTSIDGTSARPTYPVAPPNTTRITSAVMVMVNPSKKRALTAGGNNPHCRSSATRRSALSGRNGGLGGCPPTASCAGGMSRHRRRQRSQLRSRIPELTRISRSPSPLRSEAHERTAKVVHVNRDPKTWAIRRRAPTAKCAWLMTRDMLIRPFVKERRCQQ